jgi:uncharacterized DUF497 family protein
MADFDPAKDAINRSKHGVSFARRVDLEVFAIVRDDRFDYTAWRIAWFSPFASSATDRSALRRARAKELRRHAPKS